MRAITGQAGTGSLTRGTVRSTPTNATLPGNDRLLFGMILGVLAFWLFAQTTLNVSCFGRQGQP